MITSNLKVLLAKKNLSISKIHEMTGISRSTLTLLCNGKSKGIDFETLDSLCSCLDVLPGEVLIFSPYSIIFETDTGNKTVQFCVKNITTNRSFGVEFIVEIHATDIWLNHFSDDDRKFEQLVEIIKELPSYYISKLNEKLNQSLSFMLFDYPDYFLSIERNLY